MSYDLYTEHQQVLREQTSKLPQTPKTKAQIQSQFEDLLQALHFLNKPDIVPHVSIDPEDDHSLNRSSPFCQQCESLENHLKREEKENQKLKDEIRQLKTEANRWSKLDEECKNIQQKLRNLNENELRLKQQNSEFSREIEKLRKEPAYNDTVFYELQELQNRNRKLEKQLIENIPPEPLETEDIICLRKDYETLQRAYRGLEETYSKDMKALTEKYTTVFAKNSALEIERERLQLRNTRYQDHPLEDTKHLQELEGNIYSLEATLAKQIQLNDQLKETLRNRTPQADSCLNRVHMGPQKRPLSQRRNRTPSTCSKTPKRPLRNS